MTVDECKRAIQKVFEDTSVSQDETRDRLLDLRELIDELIEALQ